MASKKRKANLYKFSLPKSAAGGGGDGFDPNDKKMLEIKLFNMLMNY